MTAIVLTRAGPLTSLQDAGRSGLLRHGIGASGPMDRGAFERAAGWLGSAGRTGIEFTAAGLGFTVEEGSVSAATDGGHFAIAINGKPRQWPTRVLLKAGDTVEITPGRSGNYGYLRFDREIAVPPVLGSTATNLTVGLGGFEGRALRVGDRIDLGPALPRALSTHPRAQEPAEGPIRIIWGLHADSFAAAVRARFVDAAFRISSRMDRMGVRLDDPGAVFAGLAQLSLVSDAIVPGDIQMLGDGTPIVLMRDHQPTGGYPRIATLASADLDRFAQLRPGSEVRFEPVTVAHAQGLLSGGRA
jgi:biotin-dependent carboxylase-like uncharacterized protein